MDSLPLPYITQTVYPANRHSPDCMSTVLCRTISDCPAKQFNVRLCIRPCAPVLLLFYSRVPKTLEHSRSLKFTVRVMSRIWFKFDIIIVWSDFLCQRLY